MYDLIYNFIVDNLLQNTQLESMSSSVLGQTLSLQEWLGHSLSIAMIVCIVVVLALFVRWIFRVFAGLFGK